MLPSKLTVCAARDRLPLFLLRESMCFFVCVRLLSQWDLWLACAAWSCCLVWRSGVSHIRVAHAVWLENWLHWGSIAQQLKSTVYSAAWIVTLLTIKDEFKNGERCPELSFSHYCLHFNNSNCQGDCLFSEEPITFSDGPPRLQTVQYAYSRL